MWLFSKPKPPEDDLDARILKAAATLVQANYRGQLARRQSSTLRQDDPLLRAIARRGVDARGADGARHGGHRTAAVARADP